MVQRILYLAIEPYPYLPTSATQLRVFFMFVLFTLAFLLKHYVTQAVPLPTPSPTPLTFQAPVVPRDVPSDNCQGRTVVEILWSCLATTFACTWVSVHPNVPFKGEGKWSLVRRRIFLMLFSILAPEFMVMWAFKQWRGAVMIKEAVNAASPGLGMWLTLWLNRHANERRQAMDHNSRPFFANGWIPTTDYFGRELMLEEPYRLSAAQFRANS